MALVSAKKFLWLFFVCHCWEFFLLPSEKIHSCHFSWYKEVYELKATQFSSSSSREFTFFERHKKQRALEMDKNLSCRYHKFNWLCSDLPLSRTHNVHSASDEKKIDMKTYKKTDRNFKFPHSINQSVTRRVAKYVLFVAHPAALHTSRHASRWIMEFNFSTHIADIFPLHVIFHFHRL